MKTNVKVATRAFEFLDQNLDVYQFSYCSQTGMLGIITRTPKPLKEGDTKPKFDKPENYNYNLTLYNSKGETLLTRPDIRQCEYPSRWTIYDYGDRLPNLFPP